MRRSSGDAEQIETMRLAPPGTHVVLAAQRPMRSRILNITQSHLVKSHYFEGNSARSISDELQCDLYSSTAVKIVEIVNAVLSSASAKALSELNIGNNDDFVAVRNMLEQFDGLFDLENSGPVFVETLISVMKLRLLAPLQYNTDMIYLMNAASTGMLKHGRSMWQRIYMESSWLLPLISATPNGKYSVWIEKAGGIEKFILECVAHAFDIAEKVHGKPYGWNWGEWHKFVYGKNLKVILSIIDLD
jgi:hypothetical protein